MAKPMIPNYGEFKALRRRLMLKMNSNVDMATVVPVDRMAGEDEEETQQLQDNLSEARIYLRQFKWCHHIRDEFYGCGVGGVVAVFLFCIEPTADVDNQLE